MFYGRRFVAKQLDDFVDSREDFSTPVGVTSPEHRNNLKDNSDDCTLVISATGSDLENCKHYPVIDLDVPCNLVPASRLGHTHLYINHPVSQSGMFEILEVLAKHGIVEDGYVAGSKRRGFASVRLPWVQKNEHVK